MERNQEGGEFMINWINRYLILSSILLAVWTASTQAGGPSGVYNFTGSDPTPQIALDHTQPVARGYIVPSATAIPGGARIHVDIYQDRLDGMVELWLQAAVNNGDKGIRVVNLRKLCEPISDHATIYYSRRDYDIDYRELNQEIELHAPGHANLKVGPGVPLFVYAIFSGAPSVGGYHQWGGVARGGLVFMPGEASAPSERAASSQRPVELDIAYPISQTVANPFNNPADGSGLKVGGQIRSRVETEGKFQIPLDHADRIKKELFALAEDPAAATRVLGEGWTMSAELRYMKKDENDNLILDQNGFPTPDPMVDTYYDNAHFDAAKKDMAIRYRWTEGNATGSWNFKPGLTKSTSPGIVDRIEYGVDTTDDQPKTIAKFADSLSPLNPFRIIRQVIPGKEPASFLKPAVKLVDHRYKFMLKHRSGLAIEMSLDFVEAKSLRKNHPGQGKYVQLEMDVDHLATKSVNLNSNFLNVLRTGADLAALSTVGTEAFFDGRPVFHDLQDLEPTSPIKTAREADFKLAHAAIGGIRDHVLGPDWLPGPQKYALAVSKMGILGAKKSASVEHMEEMSEKQRPGSSHHSTLYRAVGFGGCGFVFGG